VFSAQAAYPVTVLAGLPLGLFTVFLGSAAAVGLRGHPALGHHVAAVFASVPAFLLVREGFQHHQLSALDGPAALLFATGLGLVAYALSREEGGLESPRFAWAAGGALSWLVAAGAIALDREALTITWALMAAALAWLYTKVRRRGLLVFVLGLSVAVFLRLAVVLLEPSALAIGPVGPGCFNAYLHVPRVGGRAFTRDGCFARRSIRCRRSVCRCCSGLGMCSLRPREDRARSRAAGRCASGSRREPQGCLPLSWAVFAMGPRGRTVRTPARARRGRRSSPSRS
jgi:hypothetical protein